MSRRLNDLLNQAPDRLEKIMAKMPVSERTSLLWAIKADIEREHKNLVNGMTKLKTWAEFDFKAQTKRKGQFVPSALLPADVIKLVDQTLQG